MNISFRLQTIASFVEKCNIILDVGTDHGYLPIYLTKKEVCSKAIASDIHKGPVEKAKKNIKKEGLEDKIHCRIGAGFKVVKPFEVNCAVIAGMGGNLIRNIIEEGIDVFKSLDYLILQPVQNPDILRKYIYENGYDIIDEGLCLDENKYYEIMKIKYNNEPKVLDDIYYEIGEKLLEKRDPLIKSYIGFKIHKYKNILKYIVDETYLAKVRKKEVISKIEKLEELYNELDS